MSFFENIFNKPEKQKYPESYSLNELTESLTQDGFGVSSTFVSDIERFGLVEGLVISHDGNDGLRVMKLENGAGFRVVGYNDFNAYGKNKSKFAVLVREKYNNKEVHL